MMDAPNTGSTAYAPMMGNQPQPQPMQQDGPNKSLLGLACISLIALVFFAAAEGTPEWLKAESDLGNGATITVRIGLWKECVEASYMGQSNSQCATIEETDDSGNQAPHWSLFQSVRAFSILALLAALPTLVLLGMAGAKGNWKIARLAFTACGAAALCGLIAVIQFARWKNYADDEGSGGASAFKFGAAFVLEILGFILSLISGVGVFVAGRQANTAQ